MVQQCIESACGPARTNRAGSDRGNEALSSPLFQKMWREIYRPKIEKAAALQTKVNIDFLAAKNGFRLLPVSQEESVRETAVASAIFVSSLIEKSGTALMKFERLEVGVDEKALSELFKTDSLRIAARELLVKLYNPILSETLSTTVNIDDRLTPRLTSKYPGRKLEDALRIDVSQLRTKLQQLEVETGPWIRRLLNFTPDFENLLDRAVRDGRLEPWEARIFERRALRIDAARLSLKPEMLAKFQVLTVSEAAKVAETTIGMGKLFPKPSDTSATQVEKVSDSCRKKFASTLGLTAKAIHEVEAVTEKVKEAAIAVASGQMISRRGDSATLIKIIRGIKFQYTEPTVNRLRAFRFDLSEMEGQANALQSSLKEARPANAKLIDLEIVARAFGDGEASSASEESSTSPSELKDEIGKKCEQRADTSIVDGTNAYDRIRISAFTAATPEYLIPVVAHEIGHVVSAQIRHLDKSEIYPPLLTTLNCLVKRNPYTKDESFYAIAKNSTYSEEDLADHFSSQVVVWMKKNQPSTIAGTKNMGCAMIKDEGNQYSSVNYLDAFKGSPHSSSAMRLLFIANDIDEMPSGCNPLKTWIEGVSNRSLQCEVPHLGY